MNPRCQFLITALENHSANRIWVVAEIGVWKGDLAFDLLHESRIKKYYLVDPYRPYEGPLQERYRWTQEEWDTLYQDVRRRVIPFIWRVRFVREESVQAMESIKDPLDLVYIDGDHRYEKVKEDIEGWYGKICKGGILAGHDYDRHRYKPDRHKEYWGVRRAVDKFVERKGKVLERYKTNWYIVK